MLRLFIALASVVFVVGCSKGSDSNSGGNVIQQQCHGAYMYQGQTYHCGIVHKCSGFIMTSQYGQQVRCL